MILKRFLLGMTVLALLVFAAQAFGQSAGISGVVTDQSGGVLQGAKVTVKNTATNATQELMTNSAGQYKASALQVGNYTATAEKEGFATQTKADIRIGASANLNVDFKLEVGRAKTEVVEVNVATENLILESGSSIGVVLPEDKINQLPLVNSNVLDLVKVMGGVVYGDRSPVFYADDTTLAGLSASNVNVQKDGVTANDVRWATGMNTPVNLNPESIGEFKVIITPVDAEMGRGSGQVQVVTRSGSNAYHGSAVWNIQNSFLDANQWYNNKQRVTANWRNQNEMTFNANGPIFKNKTFFFVLYNQQWAMIKNNNLNVTVPTNCARKGIYRYFDGYSSGSFQQADPLDNAIANAAAANGRFNAALTIRTVNADGTPRTDLPVPHYGAGSAYNLSTNPSGTGTYSPTPTLHAVSVFGPILNSSWNPYNDPNCDQVPVGTDKQVSSTWVNYTPSTAGWASEWDQYRGRDKTGYYGRIIDKVLTANNFDTGDGLNTAGLRWTRRNIGVDNVYGIGEAPNRKQINFRVDHNFNSKHRASVSYIYEKDDGEDAMPTFPVNSYGGAINRTPQTLSASLTSTLKPTLLNELRVGLTRTNSWVNGPLKNPKTGQKLVDLMNELMPTTGWPGWQNPTMQNIPMMVGIQGFALANSANYNPYGAGRGNMGTDWGSIDPRWSYADTITLTVGRHSFRIGGEMQRTKSDQKLDGEVSFGAAAMVFPQANGGYNGPANITFYNANIAVGTADNGSARYASALNGMVGAAAGTTITNMTNLLNTMSGSLGGVRQFYFINHPDATSYNDVRSGDIWQYTYFRENQMNFFVQDNWRVTDDLTLNLGMRYEWYGVPYLGNGMTAGIKGNALNAFGLSGRSWKNWMNLNYKPGDPVANAYKNCDAANSDASGNCLPASMAFIGPDSPNPNQQLYNDDYNNFGPVFGFAYTLPWGGKGKTVLRGGIQINYMTLGRASATNMPGLTYAYNYAPSGNQYLDLSNLSSIVPLNLPSNILPPFANPTPQAGLRSAGLTVYDPNRRSPYTQSLNLILSRTIGSNLTVDVRYAGNLSRKQVNSINLNAPNYITNGLLDAFTEARAAGAMVGGAWQSNPTPTAPGQAGNPVLLDKLLAGVNIAGVIGPSYGPVGTYTCPAGTNPCLSTSAGAIYQSGAYQLRKSTSTVGNLANGNFSALASALATLDLTAAWNSAAINQFASTTLSGEVLRAAGMPENFIQANPQYSSVIYNGNFNHNNYHSMQAQVTMRPTHGLGLSATYTWSRQLGTLGFTDYGNRAADYGVTGGRNHAFTSYGTFDLPFGPNRWLFSGVSPNILGRIIGGWQMSWIHTMATGSYMSVTGQSSLWGGSQPDKVGEFDNKQGYVKWLPNATTGTYFNNKYSTASDPQCNNLSVVAASIKASCTLYGVVLASSPTTFIFQNALPGVRGNYDRNTIAGPSQWNTDMALSKSIRISEGKSFSLRVDASNVFNHAQPAYQAAGSTGSRSFTGSNPTTGMAYVFESYPFAYALRPLGYIDGKFGCRTFQAKIRFDF
jgi:hypothetical protein